MTSETSDPAIEPTIAATAAPSQPATARATLPHYRLADRIGLGGMGEVMLAHEDRIGRDVAIKRMRATAPTPDMTSRFLREARIQARLEHPAIVPVYEIGQDADGMPFFAMKRVSGTTLAAVMSGEPLQRLLRAFNEVCLAIDFAHARHVVHRDLKPANIILGEFGEVYVLDWGLARVGGERDGEAMAIGVESLDGTTMAGSTLGTPGYMSPEQMVDASQVGPAADVYSLGAILFEILAHEPLHPRGSQALTSTVGGADPSPAHRRPDLDVPPELDALCRAALALAAAERPTARELAERVQRYLDGDRDVAKRRLVASEHVAAARACLDSGSAGQRVEALRHAGRALAFDPDSRDAATLFTRMIVEPPRELPEALRVELAASETAAQKRQARAAAVSFIGIAIVLVAASASGVRSWSQWLLVGAMTALMALTAAVLSRRRARTAEMWCVVCGNAVLASLLSRVFGSLLVAPEVTCVMAVSLTSYPQLVDRGRYVIAILLISWLAPVALEQLGAIDRTWVIVDGVVQSMSTMVETESASTRALLVGANLLPIFVVGLFANALARSRRDAQRKAEIQAWHLRQLVPD